MARQIAELLVRGASRSGLTLMKLWGVWFLGVVCYQRNELEAAEQHFTQIYENRYVAQISPYRDSIAGLALIHQIQGESRQAQRMVESISEYDLEMRGKEDDRTSSLRTRLMLLQGDLEGARRWAVSFSSPPPDQALLWLEEPQVTRARVLLARGEQADLQLARQILDVLDEITDRTYNTRYKIEILTMRALALEIQGETGEAEAVLKRAIDLARPGGFIRVFVDLGKPMQEMLHRLAKQGHSVETIRRILAAFPGNDKYPVNGEGPAQPRRHPSPGEA